LNPEALREKKGKELVAMINQNKIVLSENVNSAIHDHCSIVFTFSLSESAIHDHCSIVFTFSLSEFLSLETKGILFTMQILCKI